MFIKKVLAVLLLSVYFHTIVPLQPQVDTVVDRFDNKSEADYGVYMGSDDGIAFLLAQKSTFYSGMISGFKMHISGPIRLNFISRSEAFPSVYLDFGGYASGDCPAGYEGPFFIAVWTGNPDIPDTEKVIYRYCQKRGVDEGFVGLRIKPDGMPEVFATNNTRMISSYEVDTLQIPAPVISSTDTQKAQKEISSKPSVPKAKAQKEILPKPGMPKVFVKEGKKTISPYAVDSLK